MTEGIASPVFLEFLDTLLSDLLPADFPPFFLGDLFGDLVFLDGLSYLTFGVSKSMSSMTNFFSCFFCFLPDGDVSCAAPVASIYCSRFLSVCLLDSWSTSGTLMDATSLALDFFCDILIKILFIINLE